MIDIQKELAPPPGHADTVVQAKIRSCIIAALDGLDPQDQVGVAFDLIELLQLQALAALAVIRREATLEVLSAGTMNIGQLAEYAGVSRATINRLSTEGRQRERWIREPTV